MLKFETTTEWSLEPNKPITQLLKDIAASLAINNAVTVSKAAKALEASGAGKYINLYRQLERAWKQVDVVRNAGLVPCYGKGTTIAFGREG